MKKLTENLELGDIVSPAQRNSKEIIIFIERQPTESFDFVVTLNLSTGIETEWEFEHDEENEVYQ